MKFLCPAFLIAIFALWVLVNVFGVSFGPGEPDFSGYIRDLFIEPNTVAWLAVGLVLTFAAFVALLVSRANAYRKPLSAKEEPCPPRRLVRDAPLGGNRHRSLPLVPVKSPPDSGRIRKTPRIFLRDPRRKGGII
jgi:hypothetical protein